MLTESEVNMFFMRVFAVWQLELERRLESLVFRDDCRRIVEFLVNLVKKKGRPVGNELVVRPFIAYQEIATQTATSRQTVTTTLNDLRYQKLVVFNRSQLILRNLNKLHKE